MIKSFQAVLAHVQICAVVTEFVTMVFVTVLLLGVATTAQALGVPTIVVELSVALALETRVLATKDFRELTAALTLVWGAAQSV